MRPVNGHHITRRAVMELLSSAHRRSTLKARTEALLLQADQCDKLYPWPALAASLRSDAQLLRERMP